MDEVRKSFRPASGQASRLSSFGRGGPNDTEVRQYSPYWSANKWGMATKTLPPGATVGRSTGFFDGTYAMGRSQSAKGVQLRVTPYAMPSPDVFARVQELEVEMRRLLTSRATFNEDEKTQLLKAFRLYERDLRQKGFYQPTGLVTPQQFRKVLEGVGIGVTEQEAIGFFVKYGCDGEGRLPYDVFSASLLSSRTRMLGLEQVQKGPYKMGGDYAFQGKIIYRFCRKGVFTPTGWEPGVAARSAQLPKMGLKLEFVHGYEGIRNTCQNTFFNVESKVVYYTAGVGIVYDRESHTQAFYLDHDDDITCMSMHPGRQLFATGQMQSKKCPPTVCIWDSTTLRTLQRIEFPDEENADMRMICAVGFSPTGDRLVIVTGDDRHSVFVYDWMQGRRLFSGIGKNGQPPQIFGIAWHPFIEYAAAQDPRAERAMPPADLFVTYGQKHVKFWALETVGSDGSQQFKSTAGKFSIAEVTDVYSALFLPSGLLVTGGPKGDLLLWDATGRFGNAPGSCIKIFPAHQPGSKIPSPYDGQLVWQGLRALGLRNNATELVTGGADGRINIFDVSSGRPGRLLHSVALPLNGDSDLPAARSLDVHPITGEMIVGTRGCDLLEIVQNPNGGAAATAAAAAPPPPSAWMEPEASLAMSRDDGQGASTAAGGSAKPPPPPAASTAAFLVESLIDGHEDSVYGIAFHPLRPHKYATACDNMRVHLWDAKRRQIIAKVHVGRMARSVAFSPDGKHLAIGCADGFLKVLSAESLKTTIKEAKYAAEAIEELKYSPDGSKLAAGSHDNFIDIYDAVNGYQRIARCYGHSSYITHLDWSRDSRVLQSNCGAYELLYFDGRTGKQVQESQRDTSWDTWTSTLGFPVMGVWRVGEMDTSDGTDINAVCRSYNLEQFRKYDPISGRGQYVATAGDDGRVRVFNYPCVIENAPCLEYKGHSSHVVGVRFSPDNRWVASVGGHDQAVFQWRVVEYDSPEAAHMASAPNTVFVKPRRALVDDGGTNLRIPLHDATNSNALGMTAGGGADLATRSGPGGGPPGLGENAMVPGKVSSNQPNEAQYEIQVTTSDRRGAGTNANVYIILYAGTKATPEYRLDNSKDNFERGKTDSFMIKTPDIGETIDRIRVRHDNGGPSPGWHLASVMIRNKSRPGPASVFECNRWLATDEDDGQIVRVLFSGGAKAEGRSPRVYQVVVHTSDIRGAGTDADVFLTLFGTEGSFGPVRLESSKNDFERGAENVFSVECFVGLLESIKVQHNNSGAGPAWHLKDVVIKSAGMDSLQFYADRWLSSDTSLEAVLFPTKGLAGAASTPHRYKVQVFTSADRGAGTDANVNLRIKGASGRDSGPLKLETSKNNFERGREDIFFFELPDLGDLTEIDIGHDNSGVGSQWKLDKVLIRDETANTSWRFLYDEWIPKDGTRELVVTLLAASEADGAAQEFGNYRVVVVTSDIKGAGTDARVFVQLKGQTGATERFPLETSANNFERGQRDLFTLRKVKRVGALQSILIGHDASGVGPAWHMSHAEVTDEATGKTYFFPCNQWFDAKVGDKKTERELTVADPGSSAPVMYKLTVHTSDIKGAGTDADVAVEIFGRATTGTATTSGRTTLKNSTTNLFERGNADEFTLTCPSLGTIERLWIGHNNKGAAPGWNLAGVDILNMSTGELVSFAYGDWLDAGPPTYTTETTLVPANSKGGPDLALCSYKVVVHTGDVRGAGTDANVFCSIEGDKGRTRMVKLESGRNDFERGAVDSFTFKEANVGKMLKLTIGHDGAGASDSWNLSYVEVENLSTREKAFFVAERWLDKKNGLQVELPASLGGPNGASGNRFKVTVRTSDIRGGSTDADVSIVLIGAGGRSKELRLENGANNFERNKTDEFLVDLGADDIGELQQIDIGFATTQSALGKAGSVLGLDWHLSSVLVEHLNTGGRYFFSWNEWLNKKLQRAVIKKGTPEELATADKTEYQVIVRTSDIRGAGTDASVELVIFGAAGEPPAKVDSGVIKLDNSSNNFERGAEDVFDVRCRDLGEISHIEVRSDGRGAGSAWHLQDVEIRDQRRNTVYHFPCSKWLDGAKDPASLRQVLAASHQGDAAGATVDLLEYTVTVFTSDVRSAGTDADVFIALKGTEGYTAPMKLDGRDNNFERGQRDTFTVKAVDVGELTEIDIAHNNKGAGPDWMLDSVEVYHPKQARSYFFGFKDWIKGPGAMVSRTIKVGDKAPAAAGIAAHKYRVDVYTSDIRNAGTDSDIFVKLIGASGDSGEQKLDGSGNLFERGDVNTFHISCGDLKELKALVVRSDGKGLGGDWHLDKIVVSDLTAGTQYVFPYRNWINKTEGLEKTLQTDTDGDGSGDATVAALSEYSVLVHTSDLRGAGTNAEVFLTIKGAAGTAGPNNLLKSETFSDPFERAQMDRFTIKSTFLGPLQEIQLQLKGGGLTADWHLSHVEIISLQDGARYYFPYNRWFNKKETPDFYAVIRASNAPADTSVAGGPEVTPGTAPPSSTSIAVEESMRVYQIDVETGRDRGAGTDDDVFLEMYGPAGRLMSGKPFKLDSSKNNFESGAVDRFTMRVKAEEDWLTPTDTGHPASLSLIERVALEKKSRALSLGGDWQLASLTITDMTRGHVFKWTPTTDGWFNKKEGNRREWARDRWQKSETQPLELVEGAQHLIAPAAAPGPTGSGPDRTTAGASTSMPQSSASVLEQRYKVLVNTSKKMGAGTDSRVHLEFEDATGVTWEPVLPQDKSMYESGSKDQVLGTHGGLKQLSDDVKICRAWHEGQGMFAKWHLDNVVLERLSDGRTWTFSHQDWVPATKDRSAAVIIKGAVTSEGKKPEAAPAAAAPAAAAVPAPAAPTATTAAVPPVAPSEPDRTPANASISAPPPASASVSKSTAAAAQQPHPSQPSSQQQPPLQQQPPQPPPIVEQRYKVLVNTSKKMGAGTDSRVHLEFEDATGVTWEPVLPQDKSMYESGSKDQVLGTHGGLKQLSDDVKICRAWHEGQGMFAKWHLDNVVLERLSDGRTWTFSHQDWVPATKDRSTAVIIKGAVTSEGKKPEPAPAAAAAVPAPAAPAPAPVTAPAPVPAPPPQLSKRYNGVPDDEDDEDELAAPAPAPAQPAAAAPVGWKPPPKTKEASPPLGPFVQGDGIYVMTLRFGEGTRPLAPGDELMFSLVGDDRGGEEVSPPLPQDAHFFRPSEFVLKFETPEELGSLGDLLVCRFWIEGSGNSRVNVAGLEIVEEPTLTKWIFSLPATGLFVGQGLGKALVLPPKRVKNPDAGAPAPAAAAATGAPPQKAGASPAPPKPAAIPPAPTSPWERVETAHPEDPDALLIYYFNHDTGVSTYDEPPEYARFESEYAAWYDKYYT